MSKRFYMMENFSGNTIPRDLPSALHKCKDAFTLMRYVYEDPKAPVFYVGDLSRILHDVAVAQRPEWAESSGMTKLLELPEIPVE